MTVGFSSNMYTVIESNGYVQVCVEANSNIGSLSSDGFVTFFISVTPLTAGERVYVTYYNPYTYMYTQVLGIKLHKNVVAKLCKLYCP